MATQKTKNSRLSPQMKQLERLVGTWELSGDTKGTVRYEWMEGGFFLKQQVDLKLFGRAVKATEIIGHLRPFGEGPSQEVHSRAYDSLGNTLDYVYEMEGDTLTIWGGQKGSPAYFKAQFSEDWKSSTGEWVYPDGGYQSNRQKI